MIRSAVTVSLVPEARGGPFVFWDDLPAACRKAAELGFDAIEIFAPSPDAVDAPALREQIKELNLDVAAVGTGAGMVVHGLSLTDPDADKRRRAKAFIREIIDFGAGFGAPAIIGSMQGKWGGGLDKAAALDLLREALNELGAHAAEQGVILIYEPLNRYETNLVNTVTGRRRPDEISFDGQRQTAGRSIPHEYRRDELGGCDPRRRGLYRPCAFRGFKSPRSGHGAHGSRSGGGGAG